MKKKSNVWVKFIILSVIAITFISASTGYADLVPLDFDSEMKSWELKKKHIQLNETITEKINLFNEKKSLTSQEKELFIKEFTLLLSKSYDLNDEINSGLRYLKKRKIQVHNEWLKKVEVFKRMHPEPPPDSIEAKLYRLPREPYFSDVFKQAINAKKENDKDRKRLKKCLNKLGANNFSLLIDQIKQTNEKFTFLIFSGLILLMVLIAFNILKYIRSKK